MRFWFTLWLGASRHLRAFRGLLRFRVVRTVMMARLFGRPWRIPAETAIGDMQHFAASALEEALAAGRGLRFRGGHHIAEPITWHGQAAIHFWRRVVAPSTSFRPTPAVSCCEAVGTSQPGTTRRWSSKRYGPPPPRRALPANKASPP